MFGLQLIHVCIHGKCFYLLGGDSYHDLAMPQFQLYQPKEVLLYLKYSSLQFSHKKFMQHIIIFLGSDFFPRNEVKLNYCTKFNSSFYSVK